MYNIRILQKMTFYVNVNIFVKIMNCFIIIIIKFLLVVISS
jgi:hypothetical protein